jgi:hypothetical protein
LRKTNKDDFVQGFVPHHNHGSVDYTGVAGDHVHQCLDVTSPPIMAQDGGHIHYTEGYVVFENGHTHHYQAYSGPAIPVGNGMHVHYYDFQTSEADGHRHHVKGVDQPHQDQSKSKNQSYLEKGDWNSVMLNYHTKPVENG